MSESDHRFTVRLYLLFICLAVFLVSIDSCKIEGNIRAIRRAVEKQPPVAEEE